MEDLPLYISFIYIGISTFYRLLCLLLLCAITIIVFPFLFTVWFFWNLVTFILPCIYFFTHHPCRRLTVFILLSSFMYNLIFLFLVATFVVNAKYESKLLWMSRRLWIFLPKKISGFFSFFFFPVVVTDADKNEQHKISCLPKKGSSCCFFFGHKRAFFNFFWVC